MAHKVITGTAAAGGGTTRIPPIDSGNGNTWTPRRQARKVSGAAGRDGRTASVPVIRLSNVDVEYKDASDLTLKNVSLSIYPGEFVIVIGMSGAGKSTALKMLEDIGFLCVDNMPIGLVEKFADLAYSGSGERKKNRRSSSTTLSY